MKYALVTGGSRGLGRAVCLKLAVQGWPVVINYQSNAAAAEETKRLIEEQGGQAELLRFDVSKKEEVEAALDQWEASHEADYIAVLVNNAGIRRDNVMFMMGDEEWHSVLDTSLNGFFYHHPPAAETYDAAPPWRTHREHGFALRTERHGRTD